MTEDADLLARYNYPDFTPAYFEPWMRFDASPPLGQTVEDFELVGLDGQTARLRALLQQHRLTIVEFGSFT